jgi:putative NIF3 family GTP cyclohydrolase 1 type 2
MNHISRRRFVAITAAATAGASLARPRGSAAADITAQEIVERIRKNLGVEWKADTVDTFKAGEPGTAVKGIATCAMASIEVLKQAVKTGANFVITCEPTFYARADSRTPPPRRGAGPGNAVADVASPAPADPIFAAKDELITKNNLVVWRFSDHWRLRRPDPFAQGLADTLGWSRLTSADDPTRVSIPEIGLDALAAQVKKKLNGRGGIRVVGAPQLRVRKIALLPGTTAIQASLKALPEVDVIIAGEVREWESVEYARDTVAAGGQKGLILLGRIVSEEPGMNVCAQWLKTIVPELTSRSIPVGDPYWRPA